MQIKVTAPETLRASITLPSSKSICNRALVINALAGNRVHPQNVSDCDDTRVMLNLPLRSDAPASDTETFDIGAAGTAMRFSTALLSITPGSRIITGTERMKNRPISVLVDALRSLGASVCYVEKEGFPPLLIEGNSTLKGGRVSLPGNVSSQYISALLMIGPMLSSGLVLTLTDNIVSRPYINMTLSIMRQFGADADWTSADTICVKPQSYVQRDYYVESDWSASSYWYAMVALSTDAEAKITLPALFAESLQGDSAVAEIFSHLGVRTEFEDDTVVLTKNGQLPERFDYDFVNQPDLAQTVVVVCCMLGVPFHFTGLQSLRIKETDRIAALEKELLKLGFVLQDRNDCEMMWDGSRTDVEPGASIDTYEDHRMAMAFAPCSLRMDSICINDPHVVSKSYPHYWEDLRAAGFSVN